MPNDLLSQTIGGAPDLEQAQANQDEIARLGAQLKASFQAEQQAPNQDEIARLGAELQSTFIPKEKPGVMDLFTGESRTTPELEALQEIGEAPELNELSVPAMKASFGLMTTGDDKSLRGILTKQLGDQVSFTEDSKGNTIVNLPSGQFALNKPGFSGQDLTRGAAEALAFSPAAKAGSVIKAALGAGATEGVIETLEAGMGGEFTPQDIVEAGLLGGFFKGAEDLIGAGYRTVKGRLANNVIDSADEVGIPVLTSDVLENQSGLSRLVTEAAEKIPFTGTGKDRALQQAAREAAVNDVANKYGQFSYDAIVDSLKAQRDKVKNAAGRVLGNTASKLDEAGQIPLTNTHQAISEAAEKLSRPGVISSGPATKDLNTIIKALQGAPQSFSTLMENKTAFNEIIKGADKAERTQLTSRAKSLLISVEKAMKKDMSDMAESNLSPREFAKWNKANQVYAQEAQKLTQTRLKNVLDKGDVTPESVKTMLFSKKPSELKVLFNSLTHEGKRNARSAIISDVTETLSRRAGGITPSTFTNEMKKRKLSVDTFFKGEQGRQLKGLLSVLDATKRAQLAEVTTPTGQALLVPGIGAAVGAATGPVPIISALGLGVMGRVYESPPVRNALLRLGSMPPGSTAFERGLKEATDSISAASQAARQNMSDEQ